MKKLYFVLFISLFLSCGVQAQSQDVSFLKSSYQSFKNDIQLISKCYLSRSPACSESERKQARWAAARVTGGALMLLGLLAAGIKYLLKQKVKYNAYGIAVFTGATKIEVALDEENKDTLNVKLTVPENGILVNPNYKIMEDLFPYIDPSIKKIKFTYIYPASGEVTENFSREKGGSWIKLLSR